MILTLSNRTEIQGITVTQEDNAQSLSVEQTDSTQEIPVSPDVKFLRGFSPTIRVDEVEGGFEITITDAEHVETVFVANGESVTDEQIQEAIGAYLAENPVKVDVADAAIEGDMRPITSNAVHVEMGNINALLKAI